MGPSRLRRLGASECAAGHSRARCVRWARLFDLLAGPLGLGDLLWVICSREMTNLSENEELRRGSDHHRRNGDRIWGRTSPYALTALLSIAGGGIGIPLVFPNLGVPDRFTGAEGEELREDIRELKGENRDAQRRDEELRRLIDLFVVVGPEQVRNNQASIIEALREIASLMREMQQAQLRHFSHTDERKKDER